MKILVTGPDGVLGSNIVRELLSREHEVSVLLMDKESKAITLDGLTIHRFYGNILNLDHLDKAVSGQDAVIHCAASTSVFPARDPIVNKVNIDGTQNVIDACLKHDIQRMIYVGTANSFGYGSYENPGKEGDPYLSARFGVDYMDSKQKAQEVVLEAVKTKNLPAIVVNPTFMIGPYDSRPSSGAMILAVHKGKIPGYTVGGKNFIAVKDAATAISNALTMGKIGECYILGNKNMTYQEAFDLIAKTISAKQVKRKLPDFIVKSYGKLNSFFARVFNYYPGLTKELAAISIECHYYSPEKARKEIGLPETPLNEAIEECYEWFKQNGYLNKK
ncbi:MAG: dihydroflavonol-4-reductase [Crocinitomicaceae bacterium]|jgi:dihydroflavonol-4-reductase